MNFEYKGEVSFWINLRVCERTTRLVGTRSYKGTEKLHSERCLQFTLKKTNFISPDPRVKPRTTKLRTEFPPVNKHVKKVGFFQPRLRISWTRKILSMFPSKKPPSSPSWPRDRVVDFLSSCQPSHRPEVNTSSPFRHGHFINQFHHGHLHKVYEMAKWPFRDSVNLVKTFSLSKIFKNKFHPFRWGADEEQSVCVNLNSLWKWLFVRITNVTHNSPVDLGFNYLTIIYECNRQFAHWFSTQ